jgi:acyl-CoA dehydrogenase
MRRDVFAEEHGLFREQVRRFCEREIVPRVPEWNEQGMSDRASWRRAGEEGLLGPCVPAEYGGAEADFRYAAIVNEELTRVRAHAMMVSLHADICLPYLLSYGTAEQKTRFVPPAVRGECLLGIAMTEPGTGSDLANVTTTARRDGDVWVLNGAKTFISNGQIGDLFIVVARTDPEARPKHRGISLLLVEADAPGFVRGKKLDKLGLRGQDTSELFFEDCRIPATNILGREGAGFTMLMEKLQQERLVIAVSSVASSRRALDDTIAYVKERHAFGQPIAAFQNTQFRIAELATEVEVGQAFVDGLLAAHVRGDEIVSEVSMAKWWTTDLQKRLTAACLQLHGGYGFMLETPIAMDYADAAVQSIYAGTNEIMKVIIARRLGLGECSRRRRGPGILETYVVAAGNSVPARHERAGELFHAGSGAAAGVLGGAAGTTDPRDVARCPTLPCPA